MTFLYAALRIYRKLLFFVGARFSKSYDDTNLARLIVEGDLNQLRRDQYPKCLLQNLVVTNEIQMGGQTEPRILDFGGGSGRHGFELVQNHCAKWAVVETPSMVARASEFINFNGLDFFESVNEAVANYEKFDIIHVSSALQYTEDPLTHLRTLLETKPTLVILEKFVLTRRRRVQKFMQYSLLGDNVPGAPKNLKMMSRAARYPLVAVPIGQIMEVIRETNFEVVSRNLDRRESHLPLLKGLEQWSMVLSRSESTECT